MTRGTSELAATNMSESDAQKLTERIRLTAQNFVDARDKLQVLVAEADTAPRELFA